MEGNGKQLHYSCLENLMDRGGWQATVHGVLEELDMTEQLSTYAQTRGIIQLKTMPSEELEFLILEKM